MERGEAIRSRPSVGPTVSDDDFHGSVRHRRVDTADWNDVYVVGDVHGCVDELEALVERLAPGPRDLLVFVGDLVRKGPDSAAVVDVVRDHENMLSIRGNNEDKLLDGRKTVESLDADHLAYLRTLPTAISFDDALVVHGGVDPTRPLAEQSAERLRTCRSVPAGNGYDGPFWFERSARRPRTFFGHTVLDEPFVSESAVGLDTGCVYGGALTAYDYGDDSLVSVPAARTYEPRADGKVVDPETTPGRR